jgi:hypothetical protein
MVVQQQQQQQWQQAGVVVQRQLALNRRLAAARWLCRPPSKWAFSANLHIAFAVFLLQENGFIGPLPIGRTNRPLSVLRARLNDFSGTIPLEVWELPQLMTFDVTNNRCVHETAEAAAASSSNSSSKSMRGMLPFSLACNLAGSLAANVCPSVFLNNLHLGSNASSCTQYPALLSSVGLLSAQAAGLAMCRLCY